MRIVLKLLKILGYIVLFFLLLIVVFCTYVWKVSDIKNPIGQDTAAVHQYTVQRTHDSLSTIGDNWFRHSRYGLYEMYVSGKPFDLGVKNGKLSQQLIIEQEVAFTDQIRQMIPSASYLKFLKYIVGFMNRDLPAHVKDEYKQEIYGESFAAEDSFKWVGSNYARLLNYHAAHDIGHALQNMMLVGCTSFGAWNNKTDNGELLIGRNFDFWVGDKFAEHKMVAFYAPEKGHKFAFVTWGGFVGVVSGINDKGLTVTINAAKSKIPFGAATPVSLVAREVLQYAGNIQEAIQIARSRTMFVSESFLIGSAADHKAIVIEKTPDSLDIYDPAQDNIQCTNHYQSPYFYQQELNQEQKKNSASMYRYQRLQELMQNNYPLTPQKMAKILRDRRGLGGKNIGEGNEKAVNQLVAHHSVIFRPDSLQMWVSTNPWQLGEYVCYDLRKIFALHGLATNHEVAETSLNIAPDTFLHAAAFRGFLAYRQNKMALLLHQPVDTAATVHGDPNFYDAYRVAGDYSMKQGWYVAAKNYYHTALQHEVATEGERNSMKEKIVQCEGKMKRK